MRTTSSPESNNSKLNRSIPKRANFFKFVDQLKVQESSRLTDFYNLANDNPHENSFERRRKRDQERDSKIKTQSDLLKENKISIKEFLEEMAKREIGIAYYVYILISFPQFYYIFFSWLFKL